MDPSPQGFLRRLISLNSAGDVPVRLDCVQLVGGHGSVAMESLRRQEALGRRGRPAEPGAVRRKDTDSRGDAVLFLHWWPFYSDARFIFLERKKWGVLFESIRLMPRWECF